MSETKCALLIDGTLPRGLVANASAFLAISLGQRLPTLLGPDVTDADGDHYPGVWSLPIPILQATPAQLRETYRAGQAQHDLVVVGFTNAAQATLTYTDYTQTIATMRSDEVSFLGIALYGPKRLVNRLTGKLALLR
jgi:hypothetical protein